MDIVKYNSVLPDVVDSEVMQILSLRRGWQWAAIQFSYMQGASLALFFGPYVD